MTGLLSALARVLFGWSLVGFRSLAILAGAASTVVAALVARELGASARTQTLAAVAVGLSPLLIATNGLFQPVPFDQLATMVVLWLALRLALGRGSWLLLGLAVGVGLETKYTLAVVVVLLAAGFLVWRRDVLRSTGFRESTIVCRARLSWRVAAAVEPMSYDLTGGGGDRCGAGQRGEGGLGAEAALV